MRQSKCARFGFGFATIHVILHEVPPANFSVSILGDERGHPTGQCFYPAGEAVRIDVPAVANTNGGYLLPPADLRYLLTP